MHTNLRHRLAVPLLVFAFFVGSPSTQAVALPDRPLLFQDARDGLINFDPDPVFGESKRITGRWLFHPEHGYLLVHPISSRRSMFVYDPGYGGWFFTNSRLYNRASGARLFDMKRRTWVTYERGSGSAHTTAEREFRDLRRQQDYRLRVNYGPAYPGFDYEAHFVELSDGKWMHFIERGQGAPVVLIHGLPTSAYLWRNVIPELMAKGRRVIALDLINFGYSDKDSDVFIIPGDYVPPLADFIETLGLQDITFILHDIGGQIGFLYSARHPENAAGFAFFETAVSPFPSVSGLPEFPRLARDPVFAQQLIVEQNVLVETFLGNNGFNDFPAPPVEDRGVLRQLTPEEFGVYAAPFADPADREALLLPPQIPVFIDDNGLLGPQPQFDQYLELGAYIAAVDVPKLAIFANPGFANPPDLQPINFDTGELLLDPISGLPFPTLRQLYTEIWPVSADVEDMQAPTKHFVQEDAPEELGRRLRRWLDANFYSE